MKDCKNKKRILLIPIVCCVVLLLAATAVFAYDNIQKEINDTYAYEKSGGSTVLSDAELKAALKPETDFLILGAGRDVSGNALTANEYSNYLGYINAYLRYGNGNYTVDDFLRAALAVGTCGNASNVGNDTNGNTVDLLYKGFYPYSYATISQSPSRLAMALLAVNANNAPDLGKVSRGQLKQGVISAAQSQAKADSPDVYASALLLQALAPYYRNGEATVQTVSRQLLTKLAATKMGSDGTFNGSCKDTAMMVTALCELKLNPEGNDIISKNILSGLLSFKQNGGGFIAAPGGVADKNATNFGRIALVAYKCYQSNQCFYEFKYCKDYPVNKITTANDNKQSSGGTTTGKSSTTTKKSSNSKTTSKSSSSNKTNNTKSANKSSGTNKSDSAQSSSGSVVKHTSSQGTTVKKEEFEKIKGQNSTLVYEGTWGESEPYTISFSGKNITEGKDFDASLAADVEHQIEIEAATDQGEYFRFVHAGTFPGKATVTMTVSLVDGSYKCYHYRDSTGTFEEIGSAVVNNGMATFEASEGGDYFLTSVEGDAVSLTGQTMTLDDTVDGIVPQSVFSGLMGKDADLTLDGETDRGVFYNIVFHGKDITSPQDFNMIISETSANKKAIAKLTDSPIILHFEHDGEIPGDATVTVYANLDSSQSYGLYYFNEESGEGEYIGDISVGDGEFSFMISHCCDYFLAVGESSAVLMNSVGAGLIIFFVVLGVLIIGGIGGYFFLRKKGTSLSGLLKGKKRKAKEAEALASASEETEETIAYQEYKAVEDDVVDDETAADTEGYEGYEDSEMYGDHEYSEGSDQSFDDVVWETPGEPAEPGFEDAVWETPGEPTEPGFEDDVWETPGEPAEPGFEDAVWETPGEPAEPGFEDAVGETSAEEPSFENVVWETPTATEQSQTEFDLDSFARPEEKE